MILSVLHVQHLWHHNLECEIKLCLEYVINLSLKDIRLDIGPEIQIVPYHIKNKTEYLCNHAVPRCQHKL